MNHRVIVLAILIASFILYGCAGEVQATGTPVEEPAEINAPPVIKDADQPVPAEPKELELQDPLLLSPLDPIPGEDEMIAGPVMVQESELVLMESPILTTLTSPSLAIPTLTASPKRCRIRLETS